MSRSESLSVLGSGSRWNGLLEMHGDVRVDSRFTGDIHIDGKLVIGPGAYVQGTLSSSELEIFGDVMGNVHAGTRITLRCGARLRGDIHGPVLEMEEGAVFDGRIRMEKNTMISQ